MILGAEPGRRRHGSQLEQGRRFFDTVKGFSPGIVEGDPEERAWLKYIRDIGQGFEAVPPKKGFRGVNRR